jgi:hypothetical protein
MTTSPRSAAGADARAALLELEFVRADVTACAARSRIALDVGRALRGISGEGGRTAHPRRPSAYPAWPYSSAPASSPLARKR